jgi:hypothetical protein
MVQIDTDFLKTLPENQITSGIAEMIKHGLIHSIEYLDKVKSFDILKIAELEDLIWESVLIKNDVITKDPFEKNIRKTLNYGHTLGHAIESYSLDQNRFPALLHGEAIAIGMILTNYISFIQLGFPEQTLSDTSHYIIKKFNKYLFSKEDINAIIKLLKFDKKNYNGKVLFVLLNDIGNYKLNCEVSNSLIIEAFEYYRSIHLYEFSIVISILGYAILSYFMIQFYLNYNKIKTSDSISILIETIIKSRKSVNKYIIYNLGVFIVFLTVVLINAFRYDENYINLLNQDVAGQGSIIKMVVVIIIIMILVLAVLIGFYYLVYGRYFFKLKRHVQELKQIEY